MDIAEDIGNSYVRKCDRLTGACLVESQIESFAIKERENIVEEGIFIRKLDHAASRNYLQMRDERAILLRQCVMTMSGEGESRRACQRLQPDHGRHGEMLSGQ